MPVVLLTRPQKDSELLAERLWQENYEGMIEPLLTIEPVTTPMPSLEGIGAVMLTSAHALEFLKPEHAAALMHNPCFCVGAHTAAAAESFGFKQIQTTIGDGLVLADKMKQIIAPETAILHIAGRDTDSRGRDELQQSGYTVKPWITYAADSASSLSAACQRRLREHNLDAILLFSARTAETWVKLVRQHKLETCCETMIALGISETVRDALSCLTWRRLDAAPMPTEDAMLAHLQELLPVTEVP